MPATVSLRVYTGTNAATESTAQTGISMLSIDSAATDATTRANNPVPAGESSRTKFLRLKIDAIPANAITNFKWWTDGVQTSTINLRAKEAVGTGGTSPGTGGVTSSSVAMTGDIDAFTRTAAAKGQWDTASYSLLNAVTKGLMLQLQPGADAPAGLMAQEVINYSYDET